MNEAKIEKGFKMISETAGSDKTLTKSILGKVNFSYSFCPTEKLKTVTKQFFILMLASMIIYALTMAIPTGMAMQLTDGDTVISIHERLLSLPNISVSSMAILFVSGVAGLFVKLIFLLFVITVIAMPSLRSMHYKELNNEKAY